MPGMRPAVFEIAMEITLCSAFAVTFALATKEANDGGRFRQGRAL